MKILWGIHSNALAYSMTTLGAGMMNSIFNFYYVKLFLNRYKISETAFHIAQVMYNGIFDYHVVLCVSLITTK